MATEWPILLDSRNPLWRHLSSLLYPPYPTSPDLDFKSKACGNLPIPCEFFRIAEPCGILLSGVVIFAGMSRNCVKPYDFKHRYFLWFHVCFIWSHVVKISLSGIAFHNFAAWYLVLAIWNGALEITRWRCCLQCPNLCKASVRKCFEYISHPFSLSSTMRYISAIAIKPLSNICTIEIKHGSRN